jgi:PAS domain S-box-containing protein
MPELIPAESGRDAGSDHRADRDRFAAFALAAADLLIEVGRDQRIVYVAGATRSLTGRDARHLVGREFRDLFAETHRHFARTLCRRVQRRQRMEPVKVDLERHGGSSVSVILKGCCLAERPDTLYFTVTRAVDLDAGETAHRDEETGLLAGPAFERAAARALGNPAERDVKLTMLDVDGIDELRDKAGDGAVSSLLGEIGDFLAAHAIDGMSAGRMAPNRFAVLHDSAKPADLQAEIERLSRAGDGSGRGVTVKEQDLRLVPEGLTPADAEKALAYTLGRFASGGCGTIRSLADGFRELVDDTVDRISRMRSTISEDRLNIVFQPVIDLTDRRLHHYEVLSRFEGERSPAELVRFAEGVGMIEELDLTVCQRALACMESWNDGSELTLAVNLSGRSLGSDAFVDALEGLLKPLTNRARLLFEITETAEITDLPRAQRIIQEFRRFGHKVCLDDFGAGAASFPYLQALTIDFVKIDGAYVSRMLNAMRDHAILKAMVQLCSDLGTATIAEMIETETQAQRLAQTGVRFGQGYLFGRPAPSPTPPGVLSRQASPYSVPTARRKGVVAGWR